VIVAIAGLLLPVVAVWLWLLSCQFHRSIRSRTVVVAVAVGVGLSLSSITTMWLVALGIIVGPQLVAADAVRWTATGAVAWWRLGRGGPVREWRAVVPASISSCRLTVADWLVRVLFGVIAVEAAVTAVTEYVAAPHGQWDAWAMWNQKARFLFRGGDEWTAMLAIDWSNPSHPLLVPASVARLWAYAGAELTIVPAMLGAAFGVAIVACLMGALDLRRSRAWIAGAVVLAPGTFVQQVVSQQADVPLAFFTVASLLMLRVDRIASWIESRDGRGPLLLAGTLASSGAWTKNEGAPLVVASALVVAWMAVRLGRPGRVKWYVVGAAPPLLTLAWLKLVVAPVSPSYLSESRSLESMAWGLLDIHRHAMVDPLIWQRMVVWGGSLAQGAVPVAVSAAVVLAATHARRSARLPLAVVALMLAGPFSVYLLTPLDAAWVIATSFDRIVVQIWPTLVLAVFIADERPVGSEVQGPAERSSPASG